jgi:TRAP-type C4-dicarboxylate transport system permease large subunit
MAVNLLVTARIANVTVEQTARWALWFVAALLVALIIVAIFPATALWAPEAFGF